MWIRKNNDTYDFSRWKPFDPTGWTKCYKDDDLYNDYILYVSNREKEINDRQKKYKFIDLNNKISVGKKLGIDMSLEEKCLDELKSEINNAN